MFDNLRLALHQKGISVKQYADFLGVDEKTVQDKFHGTTDFTYPELKRTCTLLLPEYSADYLFQEGRGKAEEGVKQGGFAFGMYRKEDEMLG